MGVGVLHRIHHVIDQRLRVRRAERFEVDINGPRLRCRLPRLIDSAMNGVVDPLEEHAFAILTPA